MIAQTTTRTAQSPPQLGKETLLHADGLRKGFTLHAQAGLHLNVLENVSLTVNRGDCVALQGPSGSGKSTLMRSLYGNYRVNAGAIWVRHQDRRADREWADREWADREWMNIACCEPHELIALRQQTLGYVSQFLRVIPRVPALQVAAEPLMEVGVSREAAEEKVRSLFTHLNLPERLWSLSPTTFSGGEKQRVNIARAFAVDRPILLLDEPTAALDAANRAAVIELIEEKKAQGCALVGIFHDDAVRTQVCNQILTFGSHY
ncbi:MAG: phosphonate C-P lyase system protein PhnL [Cyanobacteria bacterium J06627_32]